MNKRSTATLRAQRSASARFRSITGVRRRAYDVAVNSLGYVYVPWIGLGGPVNVFPPGTSLTATETWTTGTNYPWSITVWP